MKQQFFNTLSREDSVSILLYGDVGEGMPVDSKRVVEELIALTARYNKIDVRINSSGGDVFSGMAIYNALRSSKADITIYVDGVAASIAAIIALCGKPLYMAPYAKMMLHSVTAGSYGGIKDLEKTVEMMKLIHQDLADMIAKRLNITQAEAELRFFDGTDHWITAQEALQMKLVDGIYETDVTKPIETAEDIARYFSNSIGKRAKDDKNSFFAYLGELKNKADKWDAYQKGTFEFENKIKELEALGELQESDRILLHNTAQNNPAAFAHIMERKKTEFINKAQEQFQELTKKRRLSIYFNKDMDALKDFALTQPILFKRLFSNFFVRAIDTIEMTDNRANWTLEDYRKYAPQELMRNPELVQRLLKQQQT